MKRYLIITALLFAVTAGNAQIGEIRNWLTRKKVELKEKINQKINEKTDRLSDKIASMSDSIRLNKKRKRKHKEQEAETTDELKTGSDSTENGKTGLIQPGFKGKAGRSSHLISSYELARQRQRPGSMKNPDIG